MSRRARLLRTGTDGCSRIRIVWKMADLLVAESWELVAGSPLVILTAYRFVFTFMFYVPRLAVGCWLLGAGCWQQLAAGTHVVWFTSFLEK